MALPAAQPVFGPLQQPIYARQYIPTYSEPRAPVQRLQLTEANLREAERLEALRQAAPRWEPPEPHKYEAAPQYRASSAHMPPRPEDPNAPFYVPRTVPPPQPPYQRGRVRFDPAEYHYPEERYQPRPRYIQSTESPAQWVECEADIEYGHAPIHTTLQWPSREQSASLRERTPPARDRLRSPPPPQRLSYVDERQERDERYEKQGRVGGSSRRSPYPPVGVYRGREGREGRHQRQGQRRRGLGGQRGYGGRREEM